VIARQGRDIAVFARRGVSRANVQGRSPAAYPNHVIEMALAHAIGDKVERSYRRGDLFVKRRKLMAAWADYCAAPRRDATVTPLRARGARFWR
jgi:hypothetical protein